MSFKIIGITGSKGVLGQQLIKKFSNVKFDCFKGDISKKKDIKKWLKGKKFEALFHFAAIVPTQEVSKDFDRSLKVNYHGSKLLIDEVEKNKSTKWFLFASTSHVYKFSKSKISEKSIIKPITKYGLTKLMAEKYLLKKKIKTETCIIRIFSYTSFNQKKSFFIPSIYKKFRSNDLINLNNVNHVRDFIDISDIISAIKLLYRKKSKGIYNLGSSKPIPLKKIIKYFSNMFKKKYMISDNAKKTFLVANVRKLVKLGWTPKKNIENTLKDYHLGFIRNNKISIK
tara:strand:- start:1138 stop:1989 length:852 start_codon:yes stop_codon:yes gene_type:complete